MKHIASRSIVRILIILFWAIIFLFFLYRPSVIFSQKERKKVTVFSWAEMIDPEILNNFEKETGISVSLKFLENNEELFVKLLTEGPNGCDIIIPSDYVMEKFIKHDLVKPLDKTKLLFWNRLDPSLLDKTFDTNNTYSVPYYWAVYGLGINKTFFTNQPLHTWGLIFDNIVPGSTVAMSNAPREALLIADRYLVYTKQISFNLTAIKDLLEKQKKHVEAYVDADIRSAYLLSSGVCSAAVVATPFINNVLKQHAAIDFFIPQEGSFMIIDSIMITKNKKQNEDAIYQFINYLFRPDILKHHFKKYPFFPATTDLCQLLKESDAHPVIIDAHCNASIFSFFQTKLSEESMNSIWMDLKAF